MRLLAQFALLALLCISTTKADACFQCVMILEWAENLAIAEEDHFEEKFDAKCHEVFETDWADAVCENLVKTKLDQIVKELEDGVVPDKVCDNIGLCNLAEFFKTLGIARPIRHLLSA